MQIKKIGVVGAGIMGSGIAQVASSAGYDVVLNDIEVRFVDRGLASISNSLARMVKKEKITSDDKNAIVGRIAGSTTLEDLSEADFVVEAATEDESLNRINHAGRLIGGGLCSGGRN